MSADPFDALNMASRNLFNAGQVEAQANRIEQLEEQVAALRKELAEAQENSHILNEATAKALKPTEALREAGDALWYCLRHLNRIDAEEIAEAIEDWQEARDIR